MDCKTPVFNSSENIRYWQFLTDDLTDNEYIEIRAIPIKQEDKVFRRLVRTKEEFTNICSKCSGKYHVFAGVNPRRKDYKVSRVKFFVTDIDNPGAKDEEILRKITKYIVLSGSGLHGYIRIMDVDIYSNAELRDSVQHRNAAAILKLQKLFQGKCDRAVSDPERVLRVPGCLNLKNGAMTRWR